MIVPILIGAGVLGAVAYAASHKTAAPATSPAAAAAAPVAVAVEQVKAVLDAHMPEPLAQAVAAAVVQSSDAKGLATLAAKVEPQYPAAAAVVATRVQQIVANLETAAAQNVPTQAVPGDRMYTVVAKDTPLVIAKKLTGRSDAGMVRELAASNPTIATRVVAGQIRVGEKLKIPSSWLGTPVPSDTPITTSGTYAVVKGDSPSAIAKKLTGSSSTAKVQALAAANASKKARILAGQIAVYNPQTGAGDLLVIPESWRA